MFRRLAALGALLGLGLGPSAAPTIAAAKKVHLSGSNVERDLVSGVAGSNQAKLACPFDG